MKDILLWQLLLDTASPPEAEALLPLLQELAQRDIKVRFPFLGVLGPALDHADATVRAEAIRCLRGANGIPALRLWKRWPSRPRATALASCTPCSTRSRMCASMP
jgi:hypothetical protein